MDPEEIEVKVGELELVRIAAPEEVQKQVEKVRRFIDKVHLLAHFDKVIAGQTTDNVCIGELNDEFMHLLGLPTSAVMATPKSFFSLLESRREMAKAKDILQIVPDILSDPDQILSANDGKAGPRYQFVKNVGKQALVVFEVTEDEARNLFITAFIPSRPKSYLKKFRIFYKK